VKKTSLVLLVGGRGTRIKSITKNIPKPLIKFKKFIFLDYLITNLCKFNLDKIYLMDQDNKIFSLNIKDGTRIWDVLSISSFIKSQNLLSLAISKTGDLIILNSSADLYKIDGNTGEVYWYSNTLGSLLPDATDFFISSEIVIIDDEIIFSAGPSIFSYNLNTGSINWEKKVSAVGTPIIDGENIFFTTSNGYFVIMNRVTGKIISSTHCGIFPFHLHFAVSPLFFCSTNFTNLTVGPDRNYCSRTNSDFS